MLLYNTFVRPVEALVGLRASNFDFNDATVPLNNNLAVAICMIAYLAMVFLLPRYVTVRGKNEARFSTLNTLFLVHNTLLSACSLLLLGLIAENLLPRIVSHGLMWGFCSGAAFEADKRLQFFFYINYLFKYYELLDTLFMIKKGKKVAFLHYFHHSMTMLLCYVQLRGRTTVQWVPITINLAVHVIMYYYYSITSIPPAEGQPKKEIWWKKHLTTMQIVQFVIDNVVINTALFFGIINRYPWVSKMMFQAIYDVTRIDLRKDGLSMISPTWETFGRGTLPNDPLQLGGFVYGDRAGCYGDIYAGWFGLAVINSYLLLFIKFFIDTYSNKKSYAAAAQKKIKKNL